MQFKKYTLALVFACLFSASAMADMSGPTPMARVKEGANQLIKILSDPDMQNPQEHDKAIHRLRVTAEDYIDFRLTTMYAVGKRWLTMSPKLQDDLVEAFVQLLERTYLKRIPAYGGQKVDYKKQLISGKKAKVFTEVVDKGKKISVEFRLRYTGKQWMIYDVVAEGVSLVSNYRAQFAQILNEDSPEKLLTLIRDRIDKLDTGEDVTPDDNIKG